MSKLVASLTLKFICRALKAFHMGYISTLQVSILVLMCILRIKTLLDNLLIFITSILVTWMS